MLLRRRDVCVPLPIKNLPPNTKQRTYKGTNREGLPKPAPQRGQVTIFEVSDFAVRAFSCGTWCHAASTGREPFSPILAWKRRRPRSRGGQWVVWR